MLKRAFFIVILVALLGTPVGAQDNKFDPLALVPADFAGVLQLEISGQRTLTALNLSSLVISMLQPTRDLQPVSALDTVIPLSALDVEDASFSKDILPWLQGNIVLAYRSFGRNLMSTAQDLVMILPTENMLQAASNLSRILKAQDLPHQETYRNSLLYVGDKATIALTPQAVLIGGTEAIKEVLDVQAGDADALIQDPIYAKVRDAQADTAIVSGYIRGDNALRVLGLVLNNDNSSLTMLEAYGGALDSFRQDHSLEQLLLNQKISGVGFTMNADTLRQDAVDATLTLYTPDYNAPATSGDFNPAVLNLLPQSAMVVQSGTDATGAAYDFLVALPLFNFSGQFLSAFPVGDSIASANKLLDVPDSKTLEQAVGGFISTLGQQASFDLENDLLKHLDGSYSIALLPRPNDPLPGLNLPYDILLVAQTDDPQAALKGAAQLTQTLLALDQLDSSSVNDLQFDEVRIDPLQEPVLHLGVVDNLLVVATGDALTQSLNAQRGDDRLVSRDRWQALSGDGVPQLYVDIPAFYNTFLPNTSGSDQLQQVIHQFGWRSSYQGDGVFQVKLSVTLPSQLGQG